MARRSTSLPPYDPQLAQLVKEPPAGDGWIHEIKLNGYRIGCAIDHGRIKLLSRRSVDQTAEFPTVVDAARHLKVKAALPDGEVAAVLPDGRTSFHVMQTRTPGSVNLVYFVAQPLEGGSTARIGKDAMKMHPFPDRFETCTLPR